MNRKEIRDAIFKLLFMTQFRDQEEMPEQVRLYFDALDEGRSEIGYAHQPTGEDKLYIEEKYSRITEKLPVIDSDLNRISSGWKTSRMNKVDLSALRLAVYEICYDDTIPMRVAINEAVEIAKRFGGESSASFVNGILGKLVREESAADGQPQTAEEQPETAAEQQPQTEPEEES